MHEFSLAENMFDAALRAEGSQGKNLRALFISCGELSGANCSSLEFSLRIILEQHGLDDVAINIREVPAKLNCSCGYCYTASSLFSACPECGGMEQQVVDGKDVFLDSIEVADE